MVGVSDLFWVYQNSGPALLFALAAGMLYVWRHDIHPRLHDLEETQEQRRDRWDEQELNAQERAILIDDAHTRVDDIEEVTERLKRRVRGIEHAYAAQTGETPSGYRPDDGGDGFDSGGDD